VTRSVECDVHGSRAPAFVCSYLVLTLMDMKARGVTWTKDDDGEVSAYCDECRDRLEAGGGEWNDELEAQAGVQLLCFGCFERVLEINTNMGLN
jgi:hypothetical protein